jgi:aspartyl aminopeptidase
MEKNYRDLVNKLPTEYDHAIQAAMENAQELGFNEETDEQAFWREVYGQVMA